MISVPHVSFMIKSITYLKHVYTCTPLSLSLYIYIYIYIYIYMESAYSTAQLYWTDRCIYIYIYIYPSLKTGKTPPTDECPGYNTRQSDGEAPVQDLWEMWSTSSLSLLPGPLWPGMVVPIRISFLGQTRILDNFLYLKLFNYV